VRKGNEQRLNEIDGFPGCCYHLLVIAVVVGAGGPGASGRQAVCHV
jgi:hypothetical protein